MKRASHIVSLVVLVAILAQVGCDSVVPGHRDNLVVEAFFDSDKPLPPIHISRTRSLSASLTEPLHDLADIQVLVLLEETEYAYRASDEMPGVFVPVGEGLDRIVEAGTRFQLLIDSEFGDVLARGQLPPRLHLNNVDVTAPDKPISAILVDTLALGLDSLNLQLDATTGFIYPVQVSVSWFSSSSDDWIETRLDPVTPFSSSLINFFLLRSQVFPEVAASSGGPGLRVWTGVYAVPVETANAPLPEHSLKITLLRGDNDFARFATSRNDPVRREPVSNISGAIGFVGGVSIDSVRVNVGTGN